jgi:BirA family biotin operon repressor/biotin-[acetyl-CoA-carboxylase] ligase
VTGGALGHPRVHRRVVSSTNDLARELASSGAPHGTLVTASEQTAGRGRQGRTWSAPPGRALLMSVVLREWSTLLPLAAAVSVAEVAGDAARIKWPNDVLVDDRKIAGILVEARPQEGWAVLGIGLNVAVRMDDFPPELRETAGTLGLEPAAVEPTLDQLARRLDRWIRAGESEVIDAFRRRDWLRGREITWHSGSGRAAGIDAGGRLLVELDDGSTTAIDAGEVHLGRPG